MTRSQLVGGVVGFLTPLVIAMALALGYRYLILRASRQNRQPVAFDGLIIGALVGGLGIAPFVVGVAFLRWRDPGWTATGDPDFIPSAVTVGFPFVLLLATVAWLRLRRGRQGQSR